MGKIYLGNLNLVSILMIHVVLFFKNINAAFSQGDYHEETVTMYTFPYMSIFEEDEYKALK